MFESPCLMSHVTLPETNSLQLKINGWKITFLSGWHPFRGQGIKNHLPKPTAVDGKESCQPVEIFETLLETGYPWISSISTGEAGFFHQPYDAENPINRCDLLKPYDLDLPPTQGASHHQDYYIFS